MRGKSFVFVHGEYTGAWCWFKTIDMLEKAGHKATAVDLVSAGISPVTADDVHSLDQYIKPLYDILDSLGDSEKVRQVILVGHSMGGITVGRASGHYPDKIAGAVYNAACMWTSGMSQMNDEDDGGKHFCVGAWSQPRWFKTIDMLEKAGHKATALDLVSAGISPVNADDVHSFDQYNQPLYDFLGSLEDSEKVILVGHSLGGLTVARASERYADKIASAVHVASLMYASGQSTTPSESKYVRYRYGNGSDKPPTSCKFSPEFLKERLYNTSSSEESVAEVSMVWGLYLEEQDFQLAVLLAKPTPVVDDSTTFTQDGYYSVPRVYIRTLQDNILPLQIQDTFIANNPPQQVRTLDCDHSPFFSAAKELHQLLLDVAGTSPS